MNELDRFSSIAEALTLLFSPHVEVVIHDLKTGCIREIFNSYSKRRKGDESLLGKEDQIPQDKDVFPPYIKTNWNGRKTKSVTAVIRDSKQKPIGLFCINLDLSKWEEIHHFIQGFIQEPENVSEFLFENDWREKINSYVSNYLQQRSLELAALTRKDKQILIQLLHKEGAFEAKNAATYIADVIKISRASVYNYLKGDL
ncbi:MAG: PAS domain-containing protein [Chlamydiota bacterium]|jgi:predicted transcriptional regulator YheO